MPKVQNISQKLILTQQTFLMCEEANLYLYEAIAQMEISVRKKVCNDLKKRGGNCFLCLNGSYAPVMVNPPLLVACYARSFTISPDQ